MSILKMIRPDTGGCMRTDVEGDTSSNEQATPQAWLCSGLITHGIQLWHSSASLSTRMTAMLCLVLFAGNSVALTLGPSREVNKPENGFIVVEAESTSAAGDWSVHSFTEETPVGKTLRKGMLFDPQRSELKSAKKEQTLYYFFKTDEAANYRIAMFMGRDKSKYNAPDLGGDSRGWGDLRNNDVYVSVFEAKSGKVIQEPTRFFFGTSHRLNDRMIWGNQFDPTMGGPEGWTQAKRAQVPLRANTAYGLAVSGRGDGVIIDKITIRSDRHLKSTRSHRAPKGKTLPALPEPSVKDVDLSQHPSMARWSKAGVQGGIPKNMRVRGKIGPADNLQEAIDIVHKRGGGVLLLKKGSYHVRDRPIQMRSKVVVRGEDRKAVRIESRITKKQGSNTIQFEDTQYAGLENLTINYVPPDGSKPKHDLYRGTMPSADYRVHGVVITAGSSNNWVRGCNILNTGCDPIVIGGNNNTMTNNYIDGAYHKNGGSGYYRIARGMDNLIKGETMKNIRHFGILNGKAAYNVVVGCFFATDVNFHTGDLGYNLIEGNSMHLPKHHNWQLISTGGPPWGHMPPGNGNIVVNNLTRHERYNNSIISIKNVVYTFEGYGTPVATNLKVPEGGRFYVPAWPTREDKGRR
ncbi:MAG: right-handed parallel beta-helix repeat-containing protein [Phycisphaeraceae bacterium]|nr:right-handed parallel beta-helix repeat-containing protein [Phycisphaeraceae bacterium]